MELIETEEVQRIKIYIPREYLYCKDSDEKLLIGLEEHSCAQPPSYGYDEEAGKWGLRFDGADAGGYNVRSFAFFFDSEEDLLRFLKR